MRETEIKNTGIGAGFRGREGQVSFELESMCQRERYDSYRAVIQKRYLRDTGLKAILKLRTAAIVKSSIVNTSKKRRKATIQTPRNTKKGGKANKTC